MPFETGPRSCTTDVRLRGRKTADSKSNGRLSQRAWVTCNKRAPGSLFAASRFLSDPERFDVHSPKPRAPVCLPQCQALFHSCGHLKRARAEAMAQVAPMKRPSRRCAEIAQACATSAKKLPVTASRGITRPRKYAVERSQTHTGAPSRSASPASARPSTTPTAEPTAAISGM